jgi:hypothetical protein
MHRSLTLTCLTVSLLAACTATGSPADAGGIRRTRPAVLDGVVLNANDGLPVAGARVDVRPGGPTVITGSDGRYRATVRPGRSTVSASALDHGPAATGVRATPARTVTVPPLRLPAAAADIPTADREGVGAGPLTIANRGALPLHWVLFTRRTGATRPAPGPPPDEPYTPLAERPSNPPPRPPPTGSNPTRPAERSPPASPPTSPSPSWGAS